MSASTPAQSGKRQEDEAEESSAAERGSAANPNVPFQRCDNLWFEDGNVVLVSDDNVAYRVHRGILSRHSPVFRDMFQHSLPSENTADSFEGCPMIHLQDYSGDLSGFLSVLCDAGNSTLFNYQTSTFALITACLRLGNKYQVDHVFQKALSRLEECFPTSLSRWDDELHRYDDWVPIELKREDAICVVNLARSLHLPSVLPTAFYTCAQLGNRPLVHGIRSSDGTFQKLSPADMEACLDGRDALFERNVLSVKGHILDAATSLDCTRTETCSAGMKTLTQRASFDLVLAGTDALSTITTSWLKCENAALATPICESCVTYLRILETVVQEEVWDDLEKIFAVTYLQEPVSGR